VKFQQSRLFLLLSATIPTLLISGHAGAVSSTNPSFNEVKSSVNLAPNTAEKLNLLIPNSENLLAKKNFFRNKGPDGFREVFREVVQPQSLENLQSKASRPSAVDTLNSLLSGDTLG
jgi:hypothetical protein